jgi:hypothetical protein
MDIPFIIFTIMNITHLKNKKVFPNLIIFNNNQIIKIILYFVWLIFNFHN